MFEALAAFGIWVLLVIIIFLAIWFFIAKWIASRVNLPTVAVVLIGLVPYVGQLLSFILLILAIMNYDVGAHFNKTGTKGEVSEKMFPPIQQIPHLILLEH